MRTDARVIVVLGMHRSGTSAITKGLEVMGVNLGQHLMPGDADNVKGYFEDVDINRLNVELLARSGHDWTTLAPVEKTKLQELAGTALESSARDLLRERLSTCDTFGFKDPRMCRLLPFWMKVFSDLELEARFILMMRNPEAIAASLFSRNRIPRVKALYMWATHLIAAFTETAGYRRALIDYDELVTNTVATITRLAESLSLTNEIDQKALKVFEAEFIDQRLRHHHGLEGEGKVSTPKLILRLVSLIERAQSGQINIDDRGFSQSLRRIESELQDRVDLLAYIDTLDRIIIQDQQRLKAATAEQQRLIDAAEDKAGT